MKTFKEIIAVILCIAVITGLCTTGAFAYGFGEKEKFVYPDGDELSCVYLGEACEGFNYVEYKDEYESGYFFRKFIAKESGNYSFVGDWPDIFEIQGSEIKKAESEIFDYSMDSAYVYLEEGTYYLINSFYSCVPEPVDVRLSIDFLGEFVGVSYDKYAFKNAVEHADFDSYNRCLRNADPRVNFTEGSVIYGFGELYLESEEEFELGENSVTFDILGYTFTETLNIIDAKDLIESIEVEDVERYGERKRYYDGEISEDYIYPEEITVNFADGRSEHINAVYYDEYSPKYEFELSNGRRYTIGAYQYPGEFNICFGGYCYVDEAAEVKNASFAENIRHFYMETIEFIFNLINFDFKSIIKGNDIFGELNDFSSYMLDACKFDYGIF